MKRNTSTTKQFYLEVIDELIKIADELSTHSSFNIKPGTYRASDIHNLLKKKDKKYLERYQKGLEEWKDEGGKMEDVRAPRSFMVQNVTFTIPRVSVFYNIKYYERLAGVSGKKVHTWTFHDKREVAATSSITFASAKTMKALGAYIKSNNQLDGRFTTLSISDGCLRGTTCDFYFDRYRNRHNKRKVVGTTPYKCNATNYTPIKGYNSLSFKIAAEDIKHLYDECKISIYVDDILPDGDIRLRNPRLMIQNTSGWCVTSSDLEPISSEKIEAVDEAFSDGYESDYECKPKTDPDAGECPTDVADEVTAVTTPTSDGSQHQPLKPTATTYPESQCGPIPASKEPEPENIYEEAESDASMTRQTADAPTMQTDAPKKTVSTRSKNRTLSRRRKKKERFLRLKSRQVVFKSKSH